MNTADAALFNAIPTRISVRAYDARAIEPEKIALLKEYIAELNAASGLAFQLYGPEGSTAAAGAIDMSPKMFTGQVNWYAALVAPDTELDGEKLGYYGEKLVLYATHLGLGTCWVASTYEKATTRADLSGGENMRLWDVIPLGYAMAKTPLKQKLMRETLRKTDKKPAKLVNSDVPFAQLPEWFRTCVHAVIAGPSAINGQPVVFTYGEGTGAAGTAEVASTAGAAGTAEVADAGSATAPVISADVPDYKRDVQMNDLGIAKLHFQLAAEAAGINGTWEWGRGGQFVLG